MVEGSVLAYQYDQVLDRGMGLYAMGGGVSITVPASSRNVILPRKSRLNRWSE